MALSAAILSEELEKAWTMPGDPVKVAEMTEEVQVGKLADAIEAYLADAKVSLTGSGMAFPAFDAFRATYRPVGDATGSALALEAALVVALTGAVGDLSGLPALPGVSIVSEIAAPPIPGAASMALAAAFANNQGTTKAQADTVAAAVHLLVMTILFIVTQMVPAPPGAPVPMPVPAVPIL